MRIEIINFMHDVYEIGMIPLFTEPLTQLLKQMIIKKTMK